MTSVASRRMISIGMLHKRCGLPQPPVDKPFERLPELAKLLSVQLPDGDIDGQLAVLLTACESTKVKRPGLVRQHLAQPDAAGDVAAAASKPAAAASPREVETVAGRRIAQIDELCKRWALPPCDPSSPFARLRDVAEAAGSDLPDGDVDQQIATLAEFVQFVEEVGAGEPDAGKKRPELPPVK